MKDILMMLYELNEKYHDNKDQRIWIASTSYFALSLAILTWAIDKQGKWASYSCYLIIFITAIFLFTMLFVGFQNWAKCKSVVKTCNFDKFIKSLDVKSNKTYKKLIEDTRYPKNNVGKKIKQFFSLGIPTVMIMCVISAFYIAQLLLIISISRN